MTDRYENIRKALEMGPTPGPWRPSYDKGSTRDIFTEQGKLPVCMVRGITYVGQEQYLANGHFIAACDPDTIRELLAEMDSLRAALEAAREDAERLDALEALVKESSERALLLHHGWHKPREPSFCGLGLGNTGRTLRQAIDQARGEENGND